MEEYVRSSSAGSQRTEGEGGVQDEELNGSDIYHGSDGSDALGPSQPQLGKKKNRRRERQCEEGDRQDADCAKEENADIDGECGGRDENEERTETMTDGIA
jgi:hypothetical protein